MEKFKVPYDIEGHLVIEANSPEEATYLAWQFTPEALGAQGGLRMHPPEKITEPVKVEAAE